MDNRHLIRWVPSSIAIVSGFVLIQFLPPIAILVPTLPRSSYQRACQHSVIVLIPSMPHDLDWPFPVRIKLELHSSYALPAPKPKPTNAGHARRLKRRTEKTTPKERPREERMRRDERQRSHCSRQVSNTLVIFKLAS